MINNALSEAIFFGGTFDPPHLGHRLCASIAVSRFPKARLFVCPAAVPPLVDGQSKETSAAFEDRFQMCQLNFSEIAEEGRVIISDIETHLARPNYTFSTLQELRKITGCQNWAILIGGDQLQNLHRWHRIQELLAQVNVLIIDRLCGEQGHAFEPQRNELAKIMNENLIQIHTDEYCWEHSRTKLVFLSSPISDAASRVIRAEIGRQNYEAQALKEDVLSYINRRNLYRD